MTRIAGICAPSRRDDGPALIETMLAEVGSGSVEKVSGGFATFGRRGASSGRVSSAGGVCCVVDGHIYNAGELPEAPGPAALIGELYRKHGFEGALCRLNGDFAVALFDETDGALYLGRDRFGIKPLYYAKTDVGFAFGSQPRCLLALPGVSPEPDRRFVACFAGSHYRTFDNEPSRSPYAEIAQLPAGNYLRTGGDSVSVSPWWQLTEQPDHTESDSELAERYRELLLDAVAIRTAAASRPVFTLSGGMDSSSVLACAVRSTSQRQIAYSTVYEDATYDESDEIKPMLDDLVDKWHPVAVGAPDLEPIVRRMISMHDEPVATATWLSHYTLCENIAGDGYHTVFGGLGGDELNAGEYEYFYYFFADLRAAGADDLLERETAAWIRYHDHPIFAKSFEVMREGLARLVDADRAGVCLPDSTRLGRYSDTVRKDYFDLDSYVPIMDHPFSSYLKNRTYQDIFRETAPCCLRAADRQTTGFGLDVIWPFFDHRLVELMFRVPGTLKIRSGVTKHLLRAAMTGILPEPTRTRVKKTGWNAPAHVWFVGRGRELVLDLISSRRFIERGIYNVERVRELLDEHRAIVEGQRPVDNHMMFFWQLINLELWLSSLDS